MSLPHEDPIAISLIVCNYVDALKEQLSAGSSVHRWRSEAGLTPLFLAAWSGHVECVKVLVEHGAEVNERSVKGGTPLDVAELFGHRSVVEYLESVHAVRGATLEIRDFAEVEAGDAVHTAFLSACAQGKIEIVERMMREHPGIWDAVSTNRNECGLHLAATSGHMDVIEALLKAGAEPALQTPHDETPRHNAWVAGQTDIEERLMRAEDAFYGKDA